MVARCARAAAAGAALGVRALQRADRDLQDRARDVHAADLIVQQGGPGVLQPGLPDDVCVRQARGGAVVPRGVEARSQLRDLLLGRSVGVGLVPERPDDRAGGAARVHGGAERRSRSRRTPTRKSARSSTRSPCATSRSSIPRSGSSRTRRTRRRWRRWRSGFRTISTPRRCMPTRCSCWSRGAVRAT